MSGSSGCDVSLLRDFDTGGHLNRRTYRAGIDAGSSIDQMTPPAADGGKSSP